MDQFMIGGLEDADNDRDDTMTVDGITYLLSEKFKSMLRNSIIDWGAFLEVYNDNLNYVNMFDQVVKLLDIKENENLRDIMLPMVKKIYHLDVNAHLSCMMKQFMIYEPLSYAIHSLFNVIKHHFEFIVELFITERNKYIEKNALSHKVKLNDWDHLVNEWNEANDKYKLESSSVILLFLNPSTNLKSGIHYKIPGKDDIINQLREAIKQFHYSGFCPKVSHERLGSLLKFPLSEFVNVIKSLNPTIELPNYNHIEKLMTDILSKHPEKPKIKDDIKRESVPKELLNELNKYKKEGRLDENQGYLRTKLHITQWYVTKILELRKQLLPYGKKYEEYYIESARMISSITDIVNDKLHKFK
jgi:hypothetical protein